MWCPYRCRWDGGSDRGAGGPFPRSRGGSGSALVSNEKPRLPHPYLLPVGPPVPSDGFHCGRDVGLSRLDLCRTPPDSRLSGNATNYLFWVRRGGGGRVAGGVEGE